MENNIDKLYEKGKAIKELDDIIVLYKKTQEYWRPMFEDYLTDLRYYMGDQWNPQVQASRKANSLSTLVYNQLPAKVKYIVNNVRNAIPSIKIKPGTDGEENTANVLNGIILQYENEADADEAKINAFKSCVIGGLGAWEIQAIDSDRDGDIDIVYERIVDPTTILMDPNSTKANHSDSEFAFKIAFVSKKEFYTRWPKAEIKNIDSEYEPNEDQVQVLEYWFYDNDKLFKYVLNADSILEKYEDYKGKYIPIVFMHGEEIRIKNKVQYHGIVYNVRDMQTLLNLAKSRTADELAMSPNGQMMANPESIQAFPEFYKSSNIRNQAVIPYITGPGGDKPFRYDTFTASTGFLEVANQSNQDISQSIGIKDPSKDLPTSQSGKAIQLQMSQSDVGTYEFADNLNKAVRYSGKIVLDLIQNYIIFPSKRTIQLPDGSTQIVTVNAPYIQNDEQVIHDLSNGTYAVEVDVGPSYLTQRTEALDRMLDYLKLNPQQMTVVSDLVFKLMDVPESAEFAARLRATIPPNILAASDASNLNSNDPQKKVQILQQALMEAQNNLQTIQGQMQQLQNQNQQLTMTAQSKLQEIEADGKIKLLEIQKRLELDKAIEESKMEHELELAKLKAQHDLAMENIKSANDKELTSDKIHEQTHADIFKEEMKADIASQSYVETGRDLEY